jgi:hypothetical protein
LVVAIESIHWGSIGVRCCHGEPGSLFALWPGPVDHDLCFESAGFDRFADSDEAWDADFESILQGVLATLGSYGNPVVTGDRPVWKQSLVARLLRERAPELGLPEQLALVSRDDQFGPCRLDFGLPVRAAIYVSDGHPIVWIWLHQTVASAWQSDLRTFAGGRNAIETTLRWDHLLPTSLPFLADT